MGHFGEPDQPEAYNQMGIDNIQGGWVEVMPGKWRKVISRSWVLDNDPMTPPPCQGGYAYTAVVVGNGEQVSINPHVWIPLNGGN